MAPSLFRFIGKIYPGKTATNDKFEVDLDFNIGKVKLKIEGQQLVLQFIATFESFEKLFLEVDRSMKAFIAAQALESHFPLQIVWDEWHEIPLDRSENAENKPVRGKISEPDLNQFPISTEVLLNIIARGMEFHKEFEKNEFLKRALLDFNYALQQPTAEVPIYLYRAIESAQWYFGGEKPLIDALNVKNEVKLVKQMANDAEQGLHTRHAAKTHEIVQLSNQDVQKAVMATQQVLMRFHLQILNKPGSPE